MVVERSELQLVWPPALFVEEAQALLAAGQDDPDTLGWLMVEAFHNERGAILFADLHRSTRPPDQVVDGPSHTRVEIYDSVGVSWLRPATDLVLDLIRNVAALPRYELRRYFSQRHRQQPAQELSPPRLRSAFARLVNELADCGYFEDAFGSGCSDSDDYPDSEGQRLLVAVTGHDVPMWPLRQQEGSARIEAQWTEEQFFDVVEALHDLVARPRRRWFHSYWREWDYGDFARRPGQAVYRWRVNELLERAQVPLRLAETGSDVGLLVQAAGDGRDDLIERVLEPPAAENGDEVGHAVQLFRGRSATREAKRSAIVTLYGVLERRRPLLKQQLTSKDEAALFEIANQYDLRHRGASQHADYDTVFLDWLFWWYLATVELTDRLLARQAAT